MTQNYSHATDSKSPDENPSSSAAFSEAEVDPSKAAEMEGRIDKTWSDGRTPARQCTAHRSNGQPCRRAAINGGTVCATHGGRSPQVKRKARLRLEMAADRMAKELLGIATADDAPPAVKLAAIRDALDRAGLGAKTAVEIEVGLKPYEELLSDMTMVGGSRAESRERRGEAEGHQPDWLREELEYAIDAEVVEEDRPARAPAPRPPETAPRRESEPANSGLMRMEDALDQLRATSPPPAPQAQRRNRHRQ